MAFWSKTLGTRLGVELAKGPQGFVKSRIFFFIYFSILGIKKIVRYIDDFFI